MRAGVVAAGRVTYPARAVLLVRSSNGFFDSLSAGGTEPRSLFPTHGSENLAAVVGITYRRVSRIARITLVRSCAGVRLHVRQGTVPVELSARALCAGGCGARVAVLRRRYLLDMNKANVLPFARIHHGRS